MNLKKCFIFFFFLMNLTIVLFGNNIQINEREDDIVSTLLSISNKILLQSPGLIKNHENEKLYINEDRIYLANGNGAYLSLDNGHVLYTPFIFFDNSGPYLSTSRLLLAKKLFKNVCNNCKHEWEKEKIVLRCPKCSSKDIRANVPKY